MTAALGPATFDSPAIEPSDVAFSLVDFPDGRFLQVDLANVKVPTGAAFWTVMVDGRLKTKAYATAGSIMGTRLDRDIYGATVLVCTACRSRFPVRDGIPVLLADDAVPGPRGLGVPVA